ncbi:putative membrane protein YkoI [Alkalibacillus filiformis]|uniref:Membrane protein YkoI n=1 Tax=Alkalibacillus filiformis TaxID=200990 RepID=A0ABU0DSB7_9BACI|nr:YusW family protein [Alkalibacillus filiformis]MDQ0351337.1 putative membrane protein YkoI [Alkalibacillus filiformis]
MKLFMTLLLSSMLVIAACGTTDEPDDGLGMEDPAPEDQEGDMEAGEDTSESQNRDDEEGTGLEDQDEDLHEESEEMEEEAEEGRNYGIKEFELEMEFEDGGEWSFEYELGDNGDKEAEVEVDNGQESDREGQQAIEELERMFEAVQFSPNMSKDEVFQRIYDHLEIMEGEVKEIELDVEFEDGEILQIEEDY